MKRTTLALMCLALVASLLSFGGTASVEHTEPLTWQGPRSGQVFLPKSRQPLAGVQFLLEIDTAWSEVLTSTATLPTVAALSWDPTAAGSSLPAPEDEGVPGYSRALLSLNLPGGPTFEASAARGVETISLAPGESIRTGYAYDAPMYESPVLTDPAVLEAFAGRGFVALNFATDAFRKTSGLSQIDAEFNFLAEGRMGVRYLYQ